MQSNNMSDIVLVVYNISRNVKKEHLHEIFSAYGNVNGVYFPVYPNTNQKKNFAFIEFPDIKMAEKAALYFNGGQIDGQYIETEILDPKVLFKDNRKRFDKYRSNRFYKSRSRSRSRSDSRRRYKYNKYNK